MNNEWIPVVVPPKLKEDLAKQIFVMLGGMSVDEFIKAYKKSDLLEIWLILAENGR